MNLYEFKDLTRWIDKELVKNEIPSKYTNLINVVSQNVNQKTGVIIGAKLQYFIGIKLQVPA